MPYAEQSDKLAGPIGLLKQYVTRTGRETAEDATQIFGGRGITVTGMGRIIEMVSLSPPKSQCFPLATLSNHISEMCISIIVHHPTTLSWVARRTCLGTLVSDKR